MSDESKVKQFAIDFAANLSMSTELECTTDASAMKSAERVACAAREMVLSRGKSINMTSVVEVLRELVDVAEQDLRDASREFKKEVILKSIDVALKGTLIHKAAMKTAPSILDVAYTLPIAKIESAVIDAADKATDAAVDAAVDGADELMEKIGIDGVGDAVRGVIGDDVDAADVMEAVGDAADILEDVVDAAAPARKVLNGCCTIV